MDKQTSLLQPKRRSLPSAGSQKWRIAVNKVLVYIFLSLGAFASLVDFDSYWHPAAMKETSKFCTDDVPQLLHYKEVGYFQDIPPIHADLGELVLGEKPGRENPTERNMTCNLGLAMDDMAVAPTIYKQALEKGIGTWLPL